MKFTPLHRFVLCRHLGFTEPPDIGVLVAIVAKRSNWSVPCNASEYGAFLRRYVSKRLMREFKNFQRQQSREEGKPSFAVESAPTIKDRGLVVGSLRDIHVTLPPLRIEGRKR